MHRRADSAILARRPQLIAYLYGIWLSLDPALPLVVQLDYDVQNSLFLAMGAGAATLHLTMLRPAVHTAGYATAFFGGFTAIFIISLLANAGSATSSRDLITIVPIIFVMSLAVLVASEPSRHFVSRMLESFAIAGSCGILLYVSWYAGMPPNFGERIIGHLNPNAFGMFCTAVACASLAIRWRTIRAATIAVAFIGLYLAQSRSNILGTAVAYSLVGLLLLLQARSHIWARLIGAVCVAAVVSLFFLGEVFSDFVSHRLLHLDDPHRGLGTGGTGRVHFWLTALEVWQQSPLFGHGYRSTERFYDGGAGSTHNAYLALLIDAGIVGLLAYLVLVGTALRRGLQMTRSSMPREWAPAIALLVSYLFVGMFERFALNTGNPFSIIIILICFRLVESPRTMVRLPARRVGGEDSLSSLPAAPFRDRSGFLVSRRRPN